MGCLFCDGVPDETILETGDLIVYLSLEGHPMVVPRRHIRDVFELDDQTASAILPVAAKLARALKASMDCDGVAISQVNGAAAGQEIFISICTLFLDGKTMAKDSYGGTGSPKMNGTAGPTRCALHFLGTLTGSDRCSPGSYWVV